MDHGTTTRRHFLRGGLALGGAGVLAATHLAPALAKGDDDDDVAHLAKGDRDILIAAEIAEALAVTTYSNIVDTAPFFPRLAGDVIAQRQRFSTTSIVPTGTLRRGLRYAPLL